MKYLLAAVLFAGAIGIAKAQSPECQNPNAPVWHVNDFTANLWHRICDKEAIQQQQREATQIAQDAASARDRAAMTLAATEQNAAAEKAITHGYKMIGRFEDILLDGKEMAVASAKVQIRGFYKKVGDTELLYATNYDAYQGTDKFIRLLTEDAVRPLRERLLAFDCNNQWAGCQIAIGGHMALCHYLIADMKDYPSIPCLHVEVPIQ